MAFTAANVTAAIQAAIDDTSHVQLHDGDPGSGGTDNVAGEVSGREAITFTAGNPATGTVTFAISGAGGPYSYVTGWNQSTTGTHQWTAELTPAEQFAGAGELEVTITATAANA